MRRAVNVLLELLQTDDNYILEKNTLALTGKITCELQILILNLKRRKFGSIPADEEIKDAIVISYIDEFETL